MTFALLAIVAMLGGPLADAPTASRSNVHIAPQDLTSALQIFGRQRGLRIIFVSEDLLNRISPGAQGKLTNDEALQELTRGTGLNFQYLDTQTVSILPAPPAVAPKVTSPPAPQSAEAHDSFAPLDQVTVISSKLPTGDALRLKTLEFIHSHNARDGASVQIARWYRPICPKSSGLSESLNGFVADRIRQIAAAAEVPQANRACDRANIEIMFTGEPQKLLDEIADRYQGVLGYPYLSKLKQRTAVTSPIQSWYATASRKQVVDWAIGSSNGWKPDHESDPDPNIITGTRLPATLETALTNVLIVVDTKNVGDRRLGAIADYVAMLALSPVKAGDRCDALPSILALTAPSCPSASRPESLTLSDVAYLKSLYAENAGHWSSTTIESVADHMYLELDAGQSAVSQP